MQSSRSAGLARLDRLQVAIPLDGGCDSEYQVWPGGIIGAIELHCPAMASFIAVTDLRRFGSAAPQLGVLVSALTKRIQRFETARGFPLIERDTVQPSS